MNIWTWYWEFSRQCHLNQFNWENEIICVLNVVSKGILVFRMGIPGVKYLSSSLIFGFVFVVVVKLSVVEFGRSDFSHIKHSFFFSTFGSKDFFLPSKTWNYTNYSHFWTKKILIYFDIHSDLRKVSIYLIIHISKFLRNLLKDIYFSH